MVVVQRNVPFERVASLASTRTYELTSSFRPSYNMAVNLVRNYTRDEAHHLLNSSFAQFLADRGVVTLERELERDRSQLVGFRDQMRCHLGDFAEYWALREKADAVRDEFRKGRERARTDSVREVLASLRPGDVIRAAGQAAGASRWCCPSGTDDPPSSRRTGSSSASRPGTSRTLPRS